MSVGKPLAIAVVLLLVVGGLSHRYIEQVWRAPVVASAGEQVYQVVPGMTTRQMLHDMQRAGYWTSVESVLIGQRLFMSDFVLKVGEYRLPATASPEQLFTQFDTGQSLQRKLAFIEGEHARQWQHRLATTFAGPDTDPQIAGQWLRASLSKEAIELMQAAGLAEPAVEGWFFPDTYYYDQHTEPTDILLRAHQKMLAVLEQEWQARAAGLPYRFPYEALIMASLIEKETGVVAERAQIAGVFVRRLQRNMRLQTDPTVIYGLGEHYDGNLRRSDLRTDNPYNTYRRGGLPPTPIAMPGAGAIHAALNPAAGEALYFVARGDGTHQFSKTLEEHRAAVRQYQILNRRSDYRSAPPVTSGAGKG